MDREASLELSTLEIFLCLGAAVVVGGILGSNREMHHSRRDFALMLWSRLGAATLTVAALSSLRSPSSFWSEVPVSSATPAPREAG